MKEIKLFNPNDKPFGRLSNNSYHPITINGKNYPTVTNYIFSNMLVTSTWKTILQNTEISGAKCGNNELIKAIDFFIDPIKENNTQSNYNKIDSKSHLQQLRKSCEVFGRQFFIVGSELFY